MLRRRIERDFDITLEPFKDPIKASLGFAFLVLAGTLCRLDGKVTVTEVEAVTSVFHGVLDYPGGKRIFDRASRAKLNAEAYAKDLAKELRGRPALLEKLLAALYRIAESDGVIHPEESSFLRRLSDLFGLGDEEYERCRHAHGRRTRPADDLQSSYAVLGLVKTASETEIRSKFYELAKKYHPDHLIGLGLPQELVHLAEEKMSTINAAYARVMQASRDQARRTRVS